MQDQAVHNEATPRDVRIVDLPATRLAVLEHRGDPRRIDDTIRAFIAWRKRHQLQSDRYPTFNIFYNDPYQVAADDFRLDLGVAVDRDIPDDGTGITYRTLPAGRCAVLRYVGSDDYLQQAFAYLYGTWLPQSGEAPRDVPLFAQRPRSYPDVPEHEAVMDIFLSLK